MKLDPDCVRDILLSVEKHSTMTTRTSTKDFDDDGLFGKYDSQKVDYHVRYADEAGLLNVDWSFDGYDIRDLSPEGHDFLSNIRKDENWLKTKNIAEKAGSSSLNVLKNIASSVATAALNHYLGL
ncbi:MAG: DUF2513 domain-containing protein [Liquorilactobacillus nagelii]|uniref:DUF2513 domain-containing protein n=1 Tax=Lactobacillaceae TaxID=33958 RepID=UPI0039EBB5CC